MEIVPSISQLYESAENKKKFMLFFT